MLKLYNFEFLKKANSEWEMEKNYQGKSLHIFAKEKLLKEMDEQVFIQARNAAQLPGLAGPVCIMPDAHSGYGVPIGTVFAMDKDEGYVSPGAVGYDINCGVRLIKTNLTKEEIIPYLEKLINLLFDFVPAGLAQRGFLKINKEELKKLVEGGVTYLVNKGIGWEEDINHIEEKGKVEGADFLTVSQEASDRGIGQIATLGSGNHYLEIQTVAEIFNKKTAENFGINEKNQIVIMVHCGSRGFGHQICSDYLQIFERHLAEFRITLNDRQLACAPIKSTYAKNYLAAMAAAANFAFINREAITHQIRKVFEKTFGKTAHELEMNLIYDVTHNMARFEEHLIPNSQKNSRLLIHRKGATRAFPNLPVIIGGSMETGSYLLVGTNEAMKKSFGSTAHGSGRTMSRTKAKLIFAGKKLWQEMRQKGIYIKSASLAGLAEEAGLAYKNISDVVESVQLSGLSEPVAYLKPIGNIKG